MADLKQVAYNAGLEIRYAIAASDLDPIQHIQAVDDIIERLLTEAERRGMEKAAMVADEHLARIPGHCPDRDMEDKVAQGYGNAAFNIAASIRYRITEAGKAALEGGKTIERSER